jgi:hypothetical protein
MSETTKPRCACGDTEKGYHGGGFQRDFPWGHGEDSCQIGEETWVERKDFELSPRQHVERYLRLRADFMQAQESHRAAAAKLDASVQETREARDAVRAQAAILARTLVP